MHHETDEALYVVEGDIVLEVGEERLLATAGSFPSCLGASLTATSPQEPGPVRVLWFLSPAGFEDFWREIGTPVVQGAEASPPTPPDRERMGKLGRKYATEFLS